MCKGNRERLFRVFIHIFLSSLIDVLSGSLFRAERFSFDASPDTIAQSVVTSSNSILRCSKMIHDDDSQRVANLSRDSLNLSSDEVSLWNRRILLEMLLSPNPSWKNNFDPRYSSQITKVAGILPFSKRLVFVIIVLLTRVLTCSVQREFCNNIYYPRRSMILRRRTYRPRWVPISYKIFATSIPIYLKLICDEIRWYV